MAITGKDDLVCPECGRIIDKNSRHPVDHREYQRFEEQVGHFFETMVRIAYLFYITLAVIGIAAYFLHYEKVLYVTTGIALLAFIIQLITGTLRFRWGVVFLPAGGVAGFFLLGGLDGICIGVLAVFLIRHVVRDIFFALVSWLISLGNR